VNSCGQMKPFRIFQYDRTTKPTVELVLQRVHPEDAALVKQTIDWVSQDGKDFDFEHRLLMPDGEVRVETHRSNGRVTIVVEDTGIGIPSEHLNRIFERFYRVDKARSREAGGTGLGLSIVKHIVERMSGTVSVESNLGRGSKFTVNLPSCA
jgi:light-regulated signal transduction histidine kinase (bacteriophytochrome)